MTSTLYRLPNTTVGSGSFEGADEPSKQDIDVAKVSTYLMNLL